jgi:hypothetical protein
LPAFAEAKLSFAQAGPGHPRSHRYEAEGWPFRGTLSLTAFNDRGLVLPRVAQHLGDQAAEPPYREPEHKQNRGRDPDEARPPDRDWPYLEL